MTWEDIGYSVRPADPYDRRMAADAHEVIMENGAQVIRIVGVWATQRDATAVSAILNALAGEQLR